LDDDDDDYEEDNDQKEDKTKSIKDNAKRKDSQGYSIDDD